MDVRANPAPLGLAAFALTTWVFGMVNAGWYAFAAGIAIILAVALVFGGLVEIIAGIWATARGDGLAATAFLSYGAFWWALVLLVVVFGMALTGPLYAWFLLLWAAVFFVVWLASFPGSLHVLLIVKALWIGFALLAIGAFSGNAVITHIGGYVELVAAVLAFYAFAAAVVNQAHGRALLPHVGQPM
jgi:uncharacterized protein